MKERRRTKKKKNPFLIFFIWILIIVGIFLLTKSSLFEIKEYQIEGNRYYSDKEILILGNCQVGGNLIWEMNGKEIKKRLEQDPYMETVQVKREYPNTVVIQIQERRQCAAIAYGEKYIVIDQEGIVLRKTGNTPQLTIVRGLTISKLSMGEHIEVEEKLLLKQCMEILSIMEKTDMYFKQIEITKSGVRASVLDYLYCDATPETLMTAMKDGKLQAVIIELFDRKIERGIIKMSSENHVSFTPKID